MAVTNYYSVGGQILGESAGGVRTDYVPDALGSVVATVDQNSAVVNQYAYKPYGSQLSKSGVGSDPSFRWVGSLGYRQTGRSRSENYVKIRHYDQKAGRWTSVNPLRPAEKPYAYANDRPVTNAGSMQLGSVYRLPRGYPAGWTTVNKGGLGAGTGCGDCGLARWQIFWMLIAPIDSDTSGYIVQHIRARRHCALCKGGECPGKLNGNTYADQYEAFSVSFTPSQNFYIAGGDTEDQWQIGGDVDCSRGFVGIFSHMRYYPGLTYNDMKSLGFSIINTCIGVGASQLCTTSTPAGWVDRSPMRSMSYQWNCCGHPPKCPKECTKLPSTFTYTPPDYFWRK